MIFNKKIDKVESRVQGGLKLIKDLDETEFKLFVKGLTLIWQGYNCVRNVKTIDEKENGDPDIDLADKVLTRETGSYIKIKNKEVK